MSIATVTQMAERVSGLLLERLGLKGQDLEEQLQKGGRKLPRRVRRAAGSLADAAQMVGNPRLRLRIDEAAVAKSYDICLRYLAPLGRNARLKAMARDIGTSIAFGLLVVGLGLAGYLAWKGVI